MDSEKCWRRHLRKLTKHVLLLVAFAAQSTHAQPTDDTTVARGFATLDAFLDGVRSLTADFEQEILNADQQLVQTDKGSLSLKRPNRFRWNYVDPTELVVAANGKQLWIYDVELEQVTVAPFDDTLGSSPAMLLSGDRNVREEFEVVNSYTDDGLDWVKLAPRGSNSDFSSVLIAFSGTAPQRLELVDGLSNVTRIAFDKVDLNPELADELFELDVPEGVKVLGGN